MKKVEIDIAMPSLEAPKVLVNPILYNADDFKTRNDALCMSAWHLN